jgi:regulator of protease activity HflC (stomatin/prohibitin superfamily)
LDHAFASKNEIAHFVGNSLAQQMSDYGYQIIHVLITDIDPDHLVKESMNEINGKIIITITIMILLLKYIITYFLYY